MKNLFYSILCLFSVQFDVAQNILISQGGTVNVSGGEFFYDAGGNDGNTSGSKTIKIN